MGMSKQAIQTEAAPAAIGTYSQAMKVGNTVYLSGQIPLEPMTMTVVAGDFKARTHQVFKNLAAVAEASGCHLQDAVKLTVYLTDLNDFNAENTNVVLEESYFIISFKSMQMINTKLFFEKLSEEVNKNINNFLLNKYSLLQAKERIIVSDIKKIINDKRLDMDVELQTLKNERENMLRVFGKTIKNPVVNNNLLGSTEYELIQNYYLLEKKIIKLMQQVNLANSEYVIRNEPSYIGKTEELNILRQQIINLKYQIQAVENPNFKSITKIGNWKVKSNNLSLVEIIIAGILFGILLNTLYLFFTSKYFRDMKI